MMKEFQGNLMPITEIEQHASTWFNLVPNYEDKTASKYNCRLCTKHYSRFYLKRKRPDMAKEEGVLKRTLGENRRDILKHEASATHQIIINQLKMEKQYNMKTEISNLAKEDYALIVTNRHMRMTYLEAKLNVGFRNHELICALLKKHSVDVGFQCCNRTAAKNMVVSISKTMLEALKKQLHSSEDPLSIIVDSSTDRSQNHFMGNDEIVYSNICHM